MTYDKPKHSSGWNKGFESRRQSSRLKTLIAVLCVLLAAIIAFTVYQYMRADKLKRQLEATRQQAFYSLIDGLASVELNLTKFMVSATPSESALLLSRIAMQAGEAQGSLSQLPVEGETIQASVKFVNQLSEYARTLAAAAASGKPYSDTDFQQLTALLTHCSAINSNLQSMMREIPDAWWISEGGEPAPLVSAMDTENASEYPSLIYDGPFSDGKHEGQAKALPQTPVDETEALQRAMTFIGAERVQATARAYDTGGPVSSYGFVIDTTDGRLNVHVTKTGGQILWMIPESGQYEPRLDIPKCVQLAEAFLSNHGYGPMESSYFQQYDGLAVINFAATQGGILLYPDLVKVQVRMDTGAIVGLEANNYLMNHTLRDLPAPDLTVDQAREMVSDRLTVSSERLCVIPLPSGEKLAYEFVGTWADSEFLIYVDAMTGSELQILKIIDAENGQLTV
ncbi:germination protein YpeB [Clostridia bacterium]|nr:germination protein YpeB [Clostridia bacterium]